jgi:ubiquitin C-terminal hydrolase
MTDKHDSTSVDDVVRKFFAKERREIKCEKCFAESATQSTEILQLPKLLLLHFKRFVVKVSADYSDISFEKNSSSIAFAPVISIEDDLEDYMANDCLPTQQDCDRYHIRSVINHHGSSVNFGHYTADALRITPVEHDADGRTKREWYRFNDDLVTKISESQAIQESSRSAYLVLYELE